MQHFAKNASYSHVLQTEKDKHPFSQHHTESIPVIFCLRHLPYRVPSGYLSKLDIEHIQQSAFIESFSCHIHYPSFMPIIPHAFMENGQIMHIEIHYFDEKDAQYQHFTQHWQGLFHQTVEKKPFFMYKNLFGYVWGNLTDMVDWVGLAHIANQFNGENSINVTLPFYAETKGRQTRLFVCVQSQQIVLDFTLQDLEAAEFINVVEKTVKTVLGWRYYF